LNGKQPKILAVDDEPLIRMILRENLEMAGYQVDEADDGEAAWRLIDAAPDAYGAVILDRMMPHLNGIDLLRRIKADLRMQFIPVILQTALGQQHEVVEGLKSGAYYYLTKPYDAQVLLSVIATALDDYQRHHSVVEKVHIGLSTLGLLRNAEYRFRTPDEAYSLAAYLSNAFPRPEQVAMGLFELFINAVEHGNLDVGYELKGRLQGNDSWREEIARRLNDPVYADRWVHVRVTRLSDALQVEVEDQGGGFDWECYLEMTAERATDTHGRGIAMAKALSFDELEYLGKGNRVRATAAIVAKNT
jgi:DNA-binding response OmpR family regulator